MILARAKFLRAMAWLTCVGIGWVRAAYAQCPDGSPPPCRMAQVAAAARRPNPPIDPRTWIVVPFENVARSSGVEWLRDASVNLLYLDLSRWQDIRVIDDERVADLLRDVPEVRGTQVLSLNAGLAIARRAGAGRLVMGDVLQAGNRIAVIAKVFDVSTARRLRSAREETTVQDSIFPLFTRLARGILAVEPPAGASLGAIGTSNIEAYQEYLAGVRLMNAFDLSGAKTRFTRALQLDSTFALAHYKLAQTVGWGFSDSPAVREHADAAARLSAKLPDRERTLIKAFTYFPRGDYPTMCATYGSLVRADSSDTDALVGLADCLFHDSAVLPLPDDTLRGRFRTNWNESLRLFRRVLSLDPTYLLAYQHIIDALTRESRRGAVFTAGGAARTAYGAPLIIDADSLLLEPLAYGSAGRDSVLARFHRSQSRRRNAEQARAVAEEWIGAAPGDSRAHLAMARVYLLLGRLQDARRHLARVGSDLPPGQIALATRERLEVMFRLLETTALVRWADSAAAAPAAGEQLHVHAVPLALTGRLGQLDSGLVFNMSQWRASAPAVAYWKRFVRIALGAPVDTAAVVESEHQSPRDYPVHPTLMFALRFPRAKWPAVDESPSDAMFRPAAALSRGDTARLRAAAHSLDSTSRVAAGALTSDRGAYLVAADAYLALRDSTAALNVLRRMLDSALARTSLFEANLPGGFEYALFVPRTMLLRADLAATLGFRDEARTWYRHVLDLWSHADPEFESLIARVKKSYAASGGT